MKRAAALAIVYAILVASATAAGFSTRYVAVARQIWFFAPSEEMGVYRLCVVTFGPDGEPRRAIVASEASFADRVWSIRSGREVIFEMGSLEAQSAKKVTGVRSELTLDPLSAPPDEPLIEKIGRAVIFSEKSSRPSYVNASLFTVDDQSRVATYIFARRAVIAPGAKEGAISLSGILLVKSWPDSRVPEMLTAQAMSFP